MKGNDGYSGSWNTCDGLAINSEVKASRDEAYEYLKEQTQKRDASAIRYHSIKRTATKRPTFGGQAPLSDVAGALFCLDYQVPHLAAPGVVIPADQLSATDRVRVKAVAEAQQTAEKAHRSARANLRALTARIEALEVVSAATIRRLQAEVKKQAALLAKANDTMAKLQARLAPRLYVTTSVDEGIKWLILGVAAE